MKLVKQNQQNIELQPIYFLKSNKNNAIFI